MAAVDFIKGCRRRIKFMSIIAAPEGLKRLHGGHPDVQILHRGAIGPLPNENAYICPVHDDVGDRIRQ